LGNGDGSFQAAVSYTTDTNPAAVVTGDFDGDGKVDLAVANSGSNTVSILLGNGDGSFRPAVSYATDSSPVALVASDFNGDSKLDLAKQAAEEITVALNTSLFITDFLKGSQVTGDVLAALRKLDQGGSFDDYHKEYWKAVNLIMASAKKSTL
jgi:FG-GAP-like repeat